MFQKGSSRLVLVLILAILAVGAALLWMNRFRYDQVGYWPYRTDRITGTVEVLNMNDGKWQAVPNHSKIKVARAPRQLDPLRDAPPSPPPATAGPSPAEMALRKFIDTTEDLPAPVLAQLQGKVKIDCLHTVCELEIDNPTTWSLTRLTLSVEVQDSSGYPRAPALEYSPPWECTSPGKAFIYQLSEKVAMKFGKNQDGDRIVSRLVSARGSRHPCPQ